MRKNCGRSAKLARNRCGFWFAIRRLGWPSKTLACFSNSRSKQRSHYIGEHIELRAIVGSRIEQYHTSVWIGVP